MVMIHSHTKSPVQRSIDSKDRVETDRRTDATFCFTFPDDAVSNESRLCIRDCDKLHQWSRIRRLEYRDGISPNGTMSGEPLVVFRVIKPHESSERFVLQLDDNVSAVYSLMFVRSTLYLFVSLSHAISDNII